MKSEKLSHSSVYRLLKIGQKWTLSEPQIYYSKIIKITSNDKRKSIKKERKFKK